LVVALALGWLVSFVYRAIRRGRIAAPTFPATLVLLAVLIALVTQVIGDNVARAFSLVGALSIVRFRTVVEDTHDIAFVIFAVVVGMAAGASSLWTALIGAAVVTGAAMVFAPQCSWNESVGDAVRPARLSLQVAVGRSLDELVGPILERYTLDSRLVAASTERGGSRLDAEYRFKFRPGVQSLHLLDELHRLEGVQRVELRNED
jgi:hypothetical protein